MFNHVEVGIDLGEFEIKMAVVKEIQESTGQSFNKLSDYETYPVSSEMYSKEYFNTMRKALIDFSKKVKKKSISLNIVLPIGNDSTVAFANMPMVSEKDLDEGMKFEVEQIYPERNSSDYQIAWKIVNEYEEINEYEITIATLSNKVIKELSQFKTIKWRINRIMFAPLILERITKENEVVVDFGYKNTRLYMYKEGLLNKIEVLSSGGSAIEEAVKVAIVNNDIEENYKEFIGKVHFYDDLVNENNILSEISKEIKPIISELLEEVKMNIRTFELQNGIDIEKVSYMGGLSSLKYLDSAIESELDMYTVPVDIVAKDLESTEYELASLIALSPKMKDKLDFSRMIKANIDYSSVMTATLTTSLSLALAFGMLNNKYDSISDEQKKILNEQVETVSNLQQEISETDERIQRNQSFIQKIDELKRQKTWLSDSLYLIPDLTPLTIAVNKIDINNKVIVMEGFSADYSSVGFYAEKLNEIGEVEINSIEDIEGNETQKEYTVTTNNPETISDKYLIKKKFKITVNHNGNLINH